MVRKFWVLAAAALAFGLAQNPVLAQSGPPSSGDSAAVFFVPGSVNLVAGLNGQGTAGDPTTWGDGGLATAAKLGFPFGVAYDSKGNLYITDSGNDDVRKIDSVTGDISLFAGTGSFGDTAPAANAQATTVALGAVTGLAIDSSDNVYFADRQNNVVWKVDSTGVITIFAGTIGVEGYTGDGGLATSATLGNPYGLAFDASGNLYIADPLNNVVRIVTTNGKINTFAGNGADAGPDPSCPATIPTLGSPAPAATSVALCGIYGVAVDPSGNVYASSYSFDQVYKINPSGDISLFAGTGANFNVNNCCETGDGGPATSAELWRPYGLYADPVGDVYIVDQFGSYVREVNTSGVINHVYGIGGDITKSILGTPDIVAESFNIGDADGIYFITMDADGNLVVPSNGVVFSAGSTGNYFFGYNNQLYSTSTSTSLNAVTPGFPPYIAISNPSGVTLNFTGTPTITGPFGIAGGTCTFPGSVAPGDSCTVIPSFTPTVDGAATGSIVIPSNANNTSEKITQNITPLTITLEGSGIGSVPFPLFTLLPSNLNFTSPTGVPSAAQQVTLQNTGQVPFTIYSYGIPNGPTFGVSPNTCPTAGSATTIAPNGTCTFNVTFTPSAPTTYNAGLQVCVSNPGYTGFCNSGADQNSVYLSGTGTGSVSFTSPPLAFGDVVVGQTSQALSAALNNGGADGLTIQTISLMGANPADYAITTGTNACVVGNVLDGGGLSGSTCNIYVTFTPGSAASFTGTLQVTLQDPSTSPPTTITEQLALSGTGIVFSSNVGTATTAHEVSVYFTTAGTLNSIKVLTQGVANLDFTSASGGTCATGTAYTVGEVCTVNVVFDPQAPGVRNGSVLLTDSSSNVLATAYLPGTGIGPEIAFEPGVQSTLPVYSGGDYSAPLGVSVDASLNVYVADTLNGRIIKIPWTGPAYGTPINLPIVGLNQPSALAIDGSGNLFITDTKNNQIVELPWNGTGYGTKVTIDASGLPDPTGIAVDGNGNVYFTDGIDQKLVEVPWTGVGYGAPVTITQATGLHSPHGVAVDAAGDLFIADSDDNQVVELPWTSSGFGAEVVVATGLFYPEAVAVDGAGDVYIANSDAGSVIEMPWNGTSFGAQITIPFGGLGNSNGLAVDANGNIYVADAFNDDVVELNVSNPPTLNFAATNVGSTSSDSPRTVTVYNIGNVDLYFNAQDNNPVYPLDFPINNNGSNLCEEDNSVEPGTSCNVSVNFTPTVAGSLSEAVVLSDNNLNANAATQSIVVNGNGIGASPTATLTGISFGSVTEGTTSAAMAATLSNTSTSAAMTITGITITGTNGDDFNKTTGTNACGTSLAASSTCMIYATFKPSIVGGETATLGVADNATGSPQTSVLSGTGAAAGAPIATLTPSLVFPATQVGQGNQLQATLSNTGNAPLTNISATLTGANADIFDIYPNGSCYNVTTLAAGSSCTISINFYPAGPDNYAAVLSVTDNAAGSPQTSTLTGEGTEAELQFSPGQFDYIAGTPGTAGDTGSGPASSALIGGGYGIALDAGGQVYFSDYQYNTVWLIDYNGNINVFAGDPNDPGGYAGDGGSAVESGLLKQPEQIAFDPSGNLYIADRGNNLIRVINANGTINTFAGNYGNGFGGYAGDGGPANQATLSSPQGVASDPQGNIYIADTNNFVIRKVDLTGKITLFAGTPGTNGYSGDNGPATSAKLGQCYQLATDQNGNVYIADFGNGVVRKVDSSGTITTYAGGGTAAVTATPQSATAVNLNNGPVGLASDPGGNLYVLGLGQTNTPGVFVVNASQQISQIVGGSIGLANGGPANVETTNPNAIAVDNSGDLYINDAYNHLVSEVGPNGDLLFPDTPVNTTSAPLTLTLSNTGNAPLSFMNPNEDGVVRAKRRYGISAAKGSAARDRGNVVDFNTYGSISGPFAIASGGTCNFDNGIAAGASCTMNVNFTPTAAGAASGSIFLYTSSGTGGTNSNYVILAGNGTAVTAPAATLSPALAFPNTNTGTTSAALVATLSNSGGATLNISGIAIGGTNPSDFTVSTGSNACGTTLAADASCSIYVTFTPASAAGFTATLTVTDNASPTTQSVTLTGTGTTPAAPIASLKPGSLSFTALSGTTSATQSATLSNSGNATLNISSIAIGGTNASVFATTTGSNACGETLAADASCIIYVTFTPSATGSFSATLNVTDNASGSPQSTTLSGTGTAPPDFTISATPATQTVQPGASASYTVTVASTGGDFTGSVALTASGLPTGATAAFSPTSVSPGSSSGNSTLTIQTAGGQLAQSRSSIWPLATPALALLFLIPMRRWRKAWKGKLMLLVVGLVSLASALTLMGCGGGFALVQPSQTYTITITGASAADPHSTTVQLTVQ